LQHLRPTALEQAGGITQLQLDRDLVTLDLDGTYTAGADRILVESLLFCFQCASGA